MTDMIGKASPPVSAAIARNARQETTPAVEAGAAQRPMERAGFPRRSRRGISIFGVVLGVAVAAVVSLALVAAYQGVVTSTRSQATLNTLTVMEATIRRSFANRPEFEDGGALQGVSISAVPSNAIQGAGNNRDIVTPWGSEITTGAGDIIGTDAASPNRFWILVSDVPEEACEAIGAAYLDRADVIGVDADGTWAAMTAAVAAAHDTVDEINTSCDDTAGDIEDVGIVFRG